MFSVFGSLIDGVIFIGSRCLLSLRRALNILFSGTLTGLHPTANCFIFQIIFAILTHSFRFVQFHKSTGCEYYAPALKKNLANKISVGAPRASHPGFATHIYLIHTRCTMVSRLTLILSTWDDVFHVWKYVSYTTQWIVSPVGLKILILKHLDKTINISSSAVDSKGLRWWWTIKIQKKTV